MTRSEIRHEFPHVQNGVYVNHAATGVFSRPVVEALARYAQARHGDDIEHWLAFEPVIDRTLERLGAVIGAPATRVEFAASTSDALSLLAEGLDWQQGDRVAVPGCEFPANVYPFLHLHGRKVETDFIPHTDGVVTLNAIEKALTPRTKLVSVSWVQFLSGYTLDLRAVADLVHAHGALLCVDAIQGVGALRIDVAEAGIDFMACGVQKWLMGPRGLAFLYVTEALQEILRPRAGWLQGPVDWDNFFDYSLAFHPDARRFRTGTLNQMGIAALHAALGLYLDADPDACAARVLENAATLRDGFVYQGLTLYGSADPRHASGIVTLAHPDPDGLFDSLTAQGIQASVRNRLVRFSPSWYNTPDEMAQVLNAVASYTRKT